MTESWDRVKVLYTIPDEATVLSEYSVLLMISSGMSNKIISLYTPFVEEDVEKIAVRYFKFPGWEESLTFSPWLYFKESNKVMVEFINKVLTKIEDRDIISKICDICIYFSIIRRELGLDD